MGLKSGGGLEEMPEMLMMIIMMTMMPLHLELKLIYKLTLNINLYNVILGTINIGGSATVVTLIRLLDIPDRQLCVVVDNCISANRQGAIHPGPSQRRIRTANTSAYRSV